MRSRCRCRDTSDLCRAQCSSAEAARSRNQLSYSVCHVGNLVMNEYQAHAGLFGCAVQRGLITSNYTVFKPSPEANADFFSRLFSSEAVSNHL